MTRFYQGICIIYFFFANYGISNYNSVFFLFLKGDALQNKIRMWLSFAAIP